MTIYFRPGWAGGQGSVNQSIYLRSLDAGFPAAAFETWTSPGYGQPNAGITAPLGPVSSTYQITGWALDTISTGPQTAISSVEVYIDGVDKGAAVLHQALPAGATNYCAQYPKQIDIAQPPNTLQPWDCNGTQANFGWTFNWNTTTIGNGSHTVEIVATDSDPGGANMASVPLSFMVQNSSTVATPAFSPVQGTYSSTQSVTISSATSGASIRFTIDGSTPTETHGTLYVSPVSVNSSETIMAIAYASGLTDSSVASAVYTINSGGTGWLPSWSYRKPITVNSGRVPGTQTNFPMLVSLPSDGDLAAHSLSNGYDIVFTDLSGTTVLNCERELFNPSTGQLIAWVNIPSLLDGTVIYMYFGNSSETTDQQNPTGTWDSHYAGVWHLPNGTTLSAADSTANGNNGTITGTTATNGQMDGAGAFNGSNQYIDIGNRASLQITGDITIEAWVNPTNYTNYNGVVGKTYQNLPGYDFYLVQSTGLPRFSRGDVSSGGQDLAQGQVTGTTAVPTATWSQLAVTMAGTEVVHYLNGATNGSGSITSAVDDSGTDALIGSRNEGVTKFTWVDGRG